MSDTQRQGLDPGKTIRDHLGWSMQISSRWADCDGYGHVNNAMYYNWVDTAVTTLAIDRGILRARGQTSIGLCIASSCRFLRPIGFPQTVDVCVRIGRLGTTSITYEAAIFILGEDAPAALADFTHVYVDHETRRSVPLTDAQRSAVRDLAPTL